jgi:hypothetical protein
MKKQAFRTLITLSLFVMLATAASVHAQTHSADLMTINIPFNFSVGKTSLMAGKYTVKRMSPSCGCFVIQSRENHGVASILTATTLQAGAEQIEPSLVFNRYEGQYFLSQVWMAESNVGSVLSKPRAERELAKNAAKPQSVMLLAHRP